jgi:hypothetical protein
MEFQVDVLLRGEIHATTHVVREVSPEPRAWTDADVALVLKHMLRAVDRQKNPAGTDREVFLRGVSWIVDPAAGGGVVIAIEIPTGAAVAGPFAVDQRELEAMIARVMERRVGNATDRVH